MSSQQRPILPQLKQLAPHFIQREIRSRYLGSLSGLAWAFIHPLAQLALYATVFVYIFGARIPEAESVGFVAYVGIAFWAWLMFSDGVNRALPAIIENTSLIAKVALPAEILVIAAVSGTLLLHLAGYALVLILLAATGTQLHLAGLVGVLPVLMMLAALTLGSGLILAACQVFIRDLAQVVQQVLTFGFFLTPILYSRAMLPEFAQKLMGLNPLTYYPERLRSLFLQGDIAPGMHDLYALLTALVVLTIGMWLFRRLAPHFEDFL